MKNPEAGVRCPVHLIDKYIGKLPPDAITQDLFYCRPLQNISSDPTKPWYSATPIGRKQLGKMVSAMCKMANIEGVKTNHSLRVSGASALFEAGIPEQIIQSRTGHRSLESLRVYEQVTNELNLNVSKILSGTTKSEQDSKASSSSIQQSAQCETEEDSCSSNANGSSMSSNKSAAQLYNGIVAPSSSIQQSAASCSSNGNGSNMSSNKSPAQLYNNCTVNMYIAPSPQDPLYAPCYRYPLPHATYFPPYPQQMPPLFDCTNYQYLPRHDELPMPHRHGRRLSKSSFQCFRFFFPFILCLIRLN